MKSVMKRSVRKCVAIFLLLVAILMTCAAVAAAGEQDVVATNFLKFLHSDKKILSSETLASNRLDATLPPIPVAYLYHLEDGGYLLIATSRSLTPVKAYSLTGNFADLPPNYRIALIEEMEALNRTLPAADSRSALSESATQNGARWSFLLNLDGASLPLAYTPDTWLIQTKWNQGYPYNKFTPRINGQATWAGCVNTALAQVLRYHQYPASSKGVVSYTWFYTWNDTVYNQVLKAILYRTYNWANMPEVLDSATPDYQIDEAASLISDLAIANETKFGLSGSSASLSTAVLTENFGYSTGLQKMYNTNAETFFSTLQTEIKAERPVLLSFPGHMVVADGYASDGTGHKIHINMGWGGSANDFYYLDQTVNAGGYTFTTNPGDLSIYYNIKPCSGSDCAVNLETGDIMTDLKLTGRFDSARDQDLYDVYLKGATKIKGSRGYSNKLYFFIYLYNKADGSLAGSVNYDQPPNQDISLGTLPAGKYTVKISWCNNDGACYSTAGYENYTVTLTSETLSEAEKADIDRSIGKPPVINNTFPDILLDSANPSTYRILVDARDEDGDAVALTIVNSNKNAIQTSLNKNILEITPVSGTANSAAKITVKASANGKTTEKFFAVMVSNETVGFGKTFEVKGIFADQADFNLHKVIMDGACTITGYNGYSSQGFYSSVQDNSGNTVVAAGYATISRTFAKNIYRLGASLKQNPGGSGSLFPYEAGKNDRYSLSVSCPDADASTATIADLLGIDLSGLDILGGDINGDKLISLADAILVLRIMAGADTGNQAISLKNTVSGKVGLTDVIYILQSVAGLR